MNVNGESGTNFLQGIFGSLFGGGQNSQGAGLLGLGGGGTGFGAADPYAGLTAASQQLTNNFTLAGTQAQLMGTQFQASGTQAQMSGMQYQASGTQAQLSGTEYMTSGAQAQAAGTGFTTAGMQAQVAGTSLTGMNAGTTQATQSLTQLGASATQAGAQLQTMGTASSAAQSASSGLTSSFGGLGNILGSVTSGFTSLLGALGNVVGGLFKGIFSIFGFAKGDVFQFGKPQFFAEGGVVGAATAFPMRNGMGIMGEKGAEAIMPLSRTDSGELGVSVDGIVPNPTIINVIDPTQVQMIALQAVASNPGTKLIYNNINLMSKEGSTGAFGRKGVRQ
jgi:hypothetical protein